MKFLDKYLTVWIFLVMFLGFGVGLIPNYDKFIDATSVNGTNIIITIGMILMLIPPFMKINFKNILLAIADWKVLLISLTLNVVIGPFLMFFLSISILNLDSEVGFRTGIIIVGIARCIAMVIVWNGLAKGRDDYACALVAINSIFQLILFLPLTLLFVDVLPNSMHITTLPMNLHFTDILKTIGLFLFLPFILAIILKFIFLKIQKIEKYESKTLPVIGIIGLVSLLITIFYIFSSKSKEFNVDNIIPIIKIVSILIIYFTTMWALGLFISYVFNLNYYIASTITFTGMGNNFELAIAITLSWFSLYKDASLAATIGPLVEVPIMLLFVIINLLIKNKWNRGYVLEKESKKTGNIKWFIQFKKSEQETIVLVKKMLKEIDYDLEMNKKIESYDGSSDLNIQINNNLNITIYSKAVDFKLMCRQQKLQ